MKIPKKWQIPLSTVWTVDTYQEDQVMIINKILFCKLKQKLFLKL